MDQHRPVGPAGPRPGHPEPWWGAGRGPPAPPRRASIRAQRVPYAGACAVPAGPRVDTLLGVGARQDRGQLLAATRSSAFGVLQPRRAKVDGSTTGEWAGTGPAFFGSILRTARIWPTVCPGVGPVRPRGPAPARPPPWGGRRRSEAQSGCRAGPRIPRRRRAPCPFCVVLVNADPRAPGRSETRRSTAPGPIAGFMFRHAPPGPPRLSRFQLHRSPASTAPSSRQGRKPSAMAASRSSADRGSRNTRPRPSGPARDFGRSSTPRDLQQSWWYARPVSIPRSLERSFAHPLQSRVAPLRTISPRVAVAGDGSALRRYDRMRKKLSLDLEGVGDVVKDPGQGFVVHGSSASGRGPAARYNPRQCRQPPTTGRGSRGPLGLPPRPVPSWRTRGGGGKTRDLFELEMWRAASAVLPYQNQPFPRRRRLWPSGTGRRSSASSTTSSCAPCSSARRS